jgi:hypothetical protein
VLRLIDAEDDATVTRAPDSARLELLEELGAAVRGEVRRLYGPSPRDDRLDVRIRDDATLGDVDVCTAEGYAVGAHRLVHACVCHAGSGGHTTSAFTEGLLDWTAGYLLDVWADRLQHGPCTADLIRTVGTHEARRLREAGTTDGAARRRGHAAAEAVVGWLGTRTAPRTLVAELAVGLDQARRPLEQKERLVTLLSPRLHPGVQQILDRWARQTLSPEDVLDRAADLRTDQR